MSNKRLRLDWSEEPSSALPWQNRHFFKGNQCLRVGNLMVRCYFDTIRFAWYIFLQKVLSNNEAYSSSRYECQFDFPVSDVPFVSNAIREIVQDLLLLATKDPTAKDMYKDTPKSYKTCDFWNKHFCRKSESKSITLRGFCDSMGSLGVRILTPNISQNCYDTNSTRFGVCRAD